MDEIETQEKPVVVLGDGNVFAIMGACKKAASKAKWTDEQWQNVRNEMMSGDYDNALQTAMKYFEVEL